MAGKRDFKGWHIPRELSLDTYTPETSLYNVILVAGVIGMYSNARDQDNRNKGKGICPTIVRTRKKKQV
jgi:hypothetical protein